jgi:endonuclease/exonuclease/phosphatase (EEP) superfamily protein YafD
VPTPPAVRKPLRLLLAGFAVLAGALSLVGFAGRLSWRADLFSHFRPQYFLVLSVFAALLFAARMKKTAAGAGALAALNGALVLQVYLPPSPPRAPPSSSEGTPLRAMMVNVYTANQEHTRVLDYIRAEDPDVVLLTEIDGHWLAALRDLESSHPHWIAEPDLGNFGIALYSRIPARELKLVSLGEGLLAPPSVVAHLRLSHLELTVIGTHPLPPVNAQYAASRNQQLERLATLVGKEPGAVLLFGDLNLSPWSPRFGDLVDATALHDTRAGFGVHATWPTDAPWLLRIPIDHCLVSAGITVRARRVGPMIGSDHLPVVVELTVPDHP